MLDTYLPLARRLLQQNELAQQLAPETLQSLLDASNVQRHSAGKVLALRGEVMADLLFILEGSLEVAMQGSDGRRSICWYLPPGQWMGLIPILDGKGAIHDLRCHSPMVLMHIPRAAFQRILHSDQQLALMCMHLLCERSRTLYDNLAAENLLPLRARVARLLLLLSNQHGRDGQSGIELTLKLSQDEFSDMLGVTRQSLNRELKALEKSAILSLAYSRITLCDVPALENLLTSSAQEQSNTQPTLAPPI